MRPRNLLSHRARPGAALLVVVSLALAAGPAALTAQASVTGHRAAAQKWTKISGNTAIGIASAGLLRTADGRLHVVWPSHDGADTFSLHYSTVGGKAKLLHTGTIFSKWGAISAYPRLVPATGKGIRLVFTGGNGTGGSPFNLGAMYTATSDEAGQSWTLVHGSLSASTTVPLTDTAAITTRSGTPVAAWATGGSLAFHVGVDGHIPSVAPDPSIGTALGGVGGPTLARDPGDGAIWAAWFDGSGTAAQGYWVSEIVPAKAGKAKAPDSGGKVLANSQPFQSVAFTARPQGGEYLAYCSPSKSRGCAHIDLWKAGAAKPMVVPGSATGQAIHVAIAPGLDGHLWVLWYDTGLNKIRVVRTNAAVTGFGPVRTVTPPPNVLEFLGLQAEGSTGPLDVISLLQQTSAKSTPAYWDTQLFAALTIHGSRSSVPHGQSTTITFTVLDTGSPVAGATVKFLGVSEKTNAKGTVKFTVKKGTAKGSHSASAAKAGYAAGSFTVKVT